MLLLFFWLFFIFHIWVGFAAISSIVSEALIGFENNVHENKALALGQPGLNQHLSDAILVKRTVPIIILSLFQ